MAKSNRATPAPIQQQLEPLSQHAFEVVGCCKQLPMHLLQEHLQQQHTQVNETPADTLWIGNSD
jgi:hypothetical protein